MQATMYEFTCPFCEHPNQVSEVNDGEIITCSNPACGKKFEADLPKVEPESHTNGGAKLLVPPDLRETEDPSNEIEKRPGENRELPVARLAPEEQPEAIPQEEIAEVVAVYPMPMFRRYPLQFIGYLLLIILGLWGFISGWIYGYNGLMIISLLPFSVGLWQLAHWWLECRNSSVTITTKGVVIRDGIFKPVSREINHKSISEVHIFQPWLCKLFRSGALVLVWGDEHERVELDSVLQPHTITNQIRHYAEKPEQARAAESEKIIAQ